MGSNLFAKPDYAEDEKQLAKESRQQFKLSEKMWKPTPDIENKIRILPARGGSNASYHMKIGKHFIDHKDRTESFICMRETYGKDCPACEAYFRLREEVNKEAARPYYPKLYGVFNILDRAEEKPKVKLYEAPRTMVWKKIIFINKGSIKVIDEFDESGEYTREGRDIIILFYPKAEVHNKYVVYPGDQTPLGTPEEIEAWHKDIIDLIPEQIALYGPIEYEIAQIKGFGTAEEREELREKLKQKYEAAQQKAEESKKTEEKVTPPVEEKSKSKDEDDAVARLEKELADAKAEKAKEAIEKKTKPAEEKPAKKAKEPEEEKPKAEPKPKKDAQSEKELDDKIKDIRQQIKDKKKK